MLYSAASAADARAAPGGNRGGTPGPEMADVFISYSRRDEEFVERLRESLADNGKDVWVDREDIGPAVEWRREIELGIEGADIFTFVITPDALRSEPCRRELEHAVSTQKRIVPLLRHEPDGLPVPEQLANRNFIYFRTDCTSTSKMLLFGRTSATAVTNPVSSSDANSVFDISFSRATPV